MSIRDFDVLISIQDFDASLSIRDDDHQYQFKTMPCQCKSRCRHANVNLTRPPRRPVFPGGSTNPSSAARPTSRRNDLRSISSHSANSCVVALPPKIQSAEINAIISHRLFFTDFPDFGHKKSPHQGAAKKRGEIQALFFRSFSISCFASAQGRRRRRCFMRSMAASISSALKPASTIFLAIPIVPVS